MINCKNVATFLIVALSFCTASCTKFNLGDMNGNINSRIYSAGGARQNALTPASSDIPQSTCKLPLPPEEQQTETVGTTNNFPQHRRDIEWLPALNFPSIGTYLLSKTVIKAPSLQDKETARDVLVGAIAFIEKFLGAPPLRGYHYTIKISPEVVTQEQVTLDIDGQRTLYISKESFTAASRRILIHELVHLYFQDDTMLDSSPFETEGLATAVENIFEHGKQFNYDFLELSKWIQESNGITSEYVLAAKQDTASWGGLSTDDRINRYKASAIFWLQLGRDEISHRYRGLIDTKEVPQKAECRLIIIKG